MKNIWLLITILLSFTAYITIKVDEAMYIILMVSLFLVLYFLKRKQLKGIFLALFLIGIGGFCQCKYETFLSYKNLPRIEGKGIVSEVRDEYFVVNRAKVKGELFPKKLYIYSSEKIKLGQEIYFRGKALSREVSMNPGSFHAELYDLSSGIDFRIKGNSIKYTGKKDFLYSFKSNILTKLESILEENLLLDNKEIISSMLLGGDLDQEKLRSFQNTGLIHLLSISGLHIGMILLVLEKLLTFSFLSKYKRKIFKHIIVFFYIFLVGFPVGALRVYIMLLFWDIGKKLEKPIEKEYALFFATSIFLFFNPFVIFNYSFLFSFLSVWGIFCIYPKILGRLPGKKNFLKESLSLSIAINIAIVPLLLIMQGKISILSVLLNIIFVPIFSLLLIFSIILIAIYFISPILAYPIGIIIDGVLSLSMIGIEFSAKNSLNILLRPFNFAEVTLYYGTLLVSLGGFLKYIKVEWAKFLIYQIIASICILIGIFYIERPDIKITQIYVGQGDCAVIETPSFCGMIDTGGSNFENDPGSKYTLSFLRSQGIHRINSLFISHFDKDHIEGLFSLTPEIKFDNIYSSYIPMDKELLSKIEEEVRPVEAVNSLKGQVDKLKIELVPHNSSSDDENSKSMVLLLTYKNRILLYTGDLPIEYEKDILKEVDHVDILKLGHHGSNTSTSNEFLQSLAPKLAIASLGIDNSYGHPHSEVLDRLKDNEVPLLRTDENGAIQLTMKDNKINVETYVPNKKTSYLDIVVFILILIAEIFLLTLIVRKWKIGEEYGIKRTL